MKKDIYETLAEAYENFKINEAVKVGDTVTVKLNRKGREYIEKGKVIKIEKDSIIVKHDFSRTPSRVSMKNIVKEEVELDEDVITLEDTQDFHEEFGYLAYSIDENDLFEAEYQGRKVKLNKPMRGDVKKFKVYVKDPKTGNVKKVNFGHGGTSAKRPTMRIRKSNPKARKSFRARHNCDNPGPKTKARYWSCRKW
jgi:hypothetical protein